jgi:uncharacterized protein (UPF0332 family)
MDARDFLHTARRLSNGLTEADWRSAASRSYYAVFHFFADILLAHGLDLGHGGQAHSNLYYGLNNCGEPTTELLAGRISFLRDERTTADYVLRSVFSQVRAWGAVGKGEDIITDFQAILATIPAQQVIDGAKAHLRAIGRIP